MIQKKFINNFLIRLCSLPINFYRYFISPLYSANCRFVPTCSNYALEALKKHGIFYGIILIIKRLAKCHPLGGGSGLDLVPEEKKNYGKNR